MMNRKFECDEGMEIVAGEAAVGGRLLRAVAGCLAAGVCLLGTAQAGDTADFEVALTSAPVAAEDEWQFAFSLNGWGPEINATTFTGSEVHLGLDDIVRSLNMIFMGTAGARKGRWSITTDLLYMNLQQSTYGVQGPGTVKADIDLSAWIVTPKIGYTLFQGDWGQFEILGGARYIHMGVDVKTTIGLPVVGNNTVFLSESGDAWAAIGGFRGHYNLNEKWYLPFYFDIGAGEPDLTVQAFAGVGYRARCFDVTFGYRYLKFDLDSSAPLADLEVKGPMLSAVWRF